jgi:hypothetical protein
MGKEWYRKGVDEEKGRVGEEEKEEEVIVEYAFCGSIL